MRLLTKSVVTELTIGELLNEYRSVKKINQDIFDIVVAIPEDNPKKQEYVDKLKKYYDWKHFLALEIADRLTT